MPALALYGRLDQLKDERHRCHQENHATTSEGDGRARLTGGYAALLSEPDNLLVELRYKVRDVIEDIDPGGKHTVDWVVVTERCDQLIPDA